MRRRLVSWFLRVLRRLWQERRSLSTDSASDETVGKGSYRTRLIAGQSARLIAGYVYANAGEGESTTDLVFGGHNIIAEDGTILRSQNVIKTRSFIQRSILKKL